MPKPKQTMLPVITVSKQRRDELHNKLKEIYNEVKARFNDFGKFQDVLTYPTTSYGSKDLKDQQEPEEFVKQFVIKPLIEFLGYEGVGETTLPTPFGMKNPDYKLKPINQEKPLFYVEAEPFNMDLFSRSHGASQVNDWLLSKASKTLYGIATDGFIWVLLKFEEASSKARPIYTVDLRPVFSRFLHKVVLGATTESDQIEENFLQFDSQTALTFLEKKLEFLEDEKEAISKNFYNDYVEYVFGYDKDGKQITGTYLLKEVSPPENIATNQSNLFAVVLMNRLIFIKFLEENEVVTKTLLKDLWGRYKESGSASSFYEAYLKSLFYEVFNKGKENRRTNVASNPLYKNIPYLNGGLFRPVISMETNYSISDEGIELVLNTFFKKYKFGSNQQINADMLGYIFEKTINYISGQGTNKQKEEGAYYTPDDIVSFIIEKTLTPVIFEKMKEGLRNVGWRDIDLKDFDSIETLLTSNDRPKSPKAIREMIKSIDTIRVVDPACGSGHFLTAMLSRILRVQESLLRSIDEKVDRYHLKKQIITRNIYGVDIDENAIEIARLRLWLSLIEELQDTKRIEPLPNIDFNIVAGNSLIGWMNENLATHPFMELLQDQIVQSSLDSLESTHPKEVTQVKKLLEKKTLTDTIKAYEDLISVYCSESGESAVKIREAIAEIRLKLYEVYNNSYNSFIHENSTLSKLDIRKFSELVDNLKTRKPFHWKVDYGAVFENKGFDVVVGNPPYIEDGNYNQSELQVIECTKTSNGNGDRDKKEPLLYTSNDCGNTHAYFIERSIKVLKDGGKFGFIVPVALVSTDRMDSIREVIHGSSSDVFYYNFDDRPSKIFRGIEHCRSTIVITEKGTGVQKVTTSKFQKWKSEDRPKLLKKLKTIQWKLENLEAKVPKIGTVEERDIIKKLTDCSGGKTINEALKSTGTKIWYYNATSNWIHAHTQEFIPRTEYFDSFRMDGTDIIPVGTGKVQISTHYKALTLDDKYSHIVNGLLNTSLFYWWFVIWSDGRDLLNQHVTSFPIDIEALPSDKNATLQTLVNQLMQSYFDNSNIKMNTRDNGKYAIRIREILPKRSKAIIDQIDDLFADYFGFTPKEKELIKTFDLKFRIEEE
jgi:type I restriction-modification system DNA methylase subunit